MKKETKLCKNCQSEIPAKAKVCLNCGKKQSGKGKWIALVVVVLLFFIAAASGGKDSADVKKTGEVADNSAKSSMDNEDPASDFEETSDMTADKQKNTETEETSDMTLESDGSETGAENTDQVFSVGDIIETNLFKISYLSAELYVEENEYLQPEDGYEYYRMEFEFENISNSDQSVSSIMNWECYADGYVMEQQYLNNDLLDTASLSPGKKSKGALYYSIPKDAGEVVLEYETDFFQQKKIVFKIK